MISLHCKKNQKLKFAEVQSKIPNLDTVNLSMSHDLLQRKNVEIVDKQITVASVSQQSFQLISEAIFVDIGCRDSEG